MNLDARRSEISLEDLTAQMAGGDELEAIAHELKRTDGTNGRPNHDQSGGTP